MLNLLYLLILIFYYLSILILLIYFPLSNYLTKLLTKKKTYEIIIVSIGTLIIILNIPFLLVLNYFIVFVNLGVIFPLLSAELIFYSIPINYFSFSVVSGLGVIECLIFGFYLINY